MNWQDLGGALVKAGAPIIGRALGGPLGGMIGDAVGGVIADALGVEPTPDAVDHAIKETPADALGVKLSAAEAEAQAKWPALAEIAKADAEAQAKALAETHETMRIEAASGDIVQRWWRPVYAFELTLECAICWALAVWDLKPSAPGRSRHGRSTRRAFCPSTGARASAFSASTSTAARARKRRRSDETTVRIAHSCERAHTCPVSAPGAATI